MRANHIPFLPAIDDHDQDADEMRAGGRQHVDVLATFGEGENLHYSEVLTQTNEAPSARGYVLRKAGIFTIMKFRQHSWEGGEYQHVDILSQANEASSAQGETFREGGEYQHVDTFTLTGPSKTLLP